MSETVHIPTCHWIDPRLNGFRYQNNGTVETVTRSADKVSLAEYSLYSSVYNRTRHIRKGYLSSFPEGIAKVSDAVPTKIEWRFLLGITDSYFSSERMKVYAVPLNSNGQDINNYIDYQYLLSSVLLSTLVSGSYNIIELDLSTYLAKVVDETWGLLVVCNSDDFSIDPGFTAAHPKTGLSITFEEQADEFKEYLRFTYAEDQGEQEITLAEIDNNTPAVQILTPFEEQDRKFKLLLRDYVETLGRVPPGLEDELE